MNCVALRTRWLGVNRARDRPYGRWRRVLQDIAARSSESAENHSSAVVFKYGRSDRSSCEPPRFAAASYHFSSRFITGSRRSRAYPPRRTCAKKARHSSLAEKRLRSLWRWQIRQSKYVAAAGPAIREAVVLAVVFNRHRRIPAEVSGSVIGRRQHRIGRADPRLAAHHRRPRVDSTLEGLPAVRSSSIVVAASGNW